MDRSSWGSIKGSVAVYHYTTYAELYRAVEDAFHTVTPQIL